MLPPPPLSTLFPYTTLFRSLQHPVASHAVEEATERAACGVILPRISHQHHKDILDNLLGRPRASGHAQGKAVERRLMAPIRSEEHTSELQSHSDLVCRLLLEKKKKKKNQRIN